MSTYFSSPEPAKLNSQLHRTQLDPAQFNSSEFNAVGLKSTRLNKLQLKLTRLNTILPLTNQLSSTQHRSTKSSSCQHSTSGRGTRCHHWYDRSYSQPIATVLCDTFYHLTRLLAREIPTLETRQEKNLTARRRRRKNRKNGAEGAGKFGFLPLKIRTFSDFPTFALKKK